MNADERGTRGAMPGESLARRELTRQIIGCYYDVFGELGYGFLESVYAEAFAIALVDRGLTAVREPAIAVEFRGRSIGTYRPDFVVEGTAVAELKAVRALENAHEAQLLNYLRASTLEIGLLLNFGRRAEFRRLIWSNARKGRVPSRSSAVSSR